MKPFRAARSYGVDVTVWGQDENLAEHFTKAVCEEFHLVIPITQKGANHARAACGSSSMVMAQEKTIYDHFDDKGQFQHWLKRYELGDIAVREVNRRDIYRLKARHFPGVVKTRFGAWLQLISCCTINAELTTCESSCCRCRRNRGENSTELGTTADHRET